MDWLNTNAVHNVMNVAIAFLVAMIGFDWTVLFSTTTAATIAGILATIKVIMNVVRDGLAGLIKPQPPVGSTVVPPGVVVIETKPAS